MRKELTLPDRLGGDKQAVSTTAGMMQKGKGPGGTESEEKPRDYRMETRWEEPADLGAELSRQGC